VKTVAAAVLLLTTTSFALTFEQVHANHAIGVDANGRHYVASETGWGPWFADAVFAPKPGYPVEDRRLHHEGIVVIRLDIDLKTGNATYVTMLKSSGFPNLDEVAVRALAKWRFKPGRWKQLEIPVVFAFFTRGEPFDYGGPGHP
jgi:TonB family protein